MLYTVHRQPTLADAMRTPFSCSSPDFCIISIFSPGFILYTRLVYRYWPQHTCSLVHTFHFHHGQWKTRPDILSLTSYLTRIWLPTQRTTLNTTLQKQVQAGQFIFTQTRAFLPHTHLIQRHPAAHLPPVRVSVLPWQRISIPEKWCNQRSFVESGSATGDLGSPRSGTHSCKPFLLSNLQIRTQTFDPCKKHKLKCMYLMKCMQ